MMDVVMAAPVGVRPDAGDRSRMSSAVSYLGVSLAAMRQVEGQRDVAAGVVVMSVDAQRRLTPGSAIMAVAATRRHQVPQRYADTMLPFASDEVIESILVSVGGLPPVPDQRWAVVAAWHAEGVHSPRTMLHVAFDHGHVINTDVDEQGRCVGVAPVDESTRCVPDAGIVLGGQAFADALIGEQLVLWLRRVDRLARALR